LIGGLATVIGLTARWVDPLATWMCWLVPLSVFELRGFFGRNPGASNHKLPRISATRKTPVA
jgi:hypothetical protein